MSSQRHRRSGDRPRRRRRGRRRLAAAALAAAALVAAIALALAATASSPRAGNGGGRNAASARGAHRPGRHRKRPAVAHRKRAHAHRRRRRRPSPGSLPQTSVLPSAHTLTFRREMSALWRAIVLGRPALARGAFFPEGAYLQLKQIEDPAGDYVDRLLHDYALDIGAAHALLGAGAARDTLVGVRVPEQYAHWVPPNVCYNGVGYYEVANSRIIYRAGTGTRSFGIASMISWRGVWYVVHLGAILRSAEEGIVEGPAEGPGVSEPSSTC